MKKKYWISSYTTECPICGRGQTTRQREYTTKPENWGDRNEIKEVYDWCNE